MLKSKNFLLTITFSLLMIFSESSADESLYYEGKRIDGKKNGKGTLYYPGGEVFYEGEFRNDKFNGYGTIRFPDGNIYKGSFKNGVMQGSGFLVYRDGRSYRGNFLDGRPHGYGVLEFAGKEKSFVNNDGKKIQRRRYEGNWLKGKMDGYGIMQYEDAIYDGYWTEGKKYGDGRMRFQDGTTCQGEWNGGVMHGRGECTYSDGSMYRGEWRYGHQSGYGFKMDNDGTKMEGQWKNGEFLNGKMTLPNGTVKVFSSVEEEYIDDKPHMNTYANGRMGNATYEDKNKSRSGSYSYIVNSSKNFDNDIVDMEKIEAHKSKQYKQVGKEVILNG